MWKRFRDSVKSKVCWRICCLQNQFIYSSLPDKSHLEIFFLLNAINWGILALNCMTRHVKKFRHERRNSLMPPSAFYQWKRYEKCDHVHCRQKRHFLESVSLLLSTQFFLLIFWVRVIFIALSFVFVTFLHVPQKIFSDCGRFREKA